MLGKVFIVAASLAVLCLPTLAEAAKRVALLIGNDTYTGLRPLGNPIRDTVALAAILKSHGYEVFSHKDLDRNAFEAALQDFEDAAKGADEAVVYYAGHGMEAFERGEHQNILAPVDAVIACENRRARNVITLTQVFKAIEKVPKQIVILDACRDNPFSTCPVRSGAGGHGFRAALLPSEGPRTSVLLAFSTAEGKLAADGKNGEHSPFAKALLAELATSPSRYFHDILDRVSHVMKDQQPWMQTTRFPQSCLAGKGCGEGLQSASASPDTARLGAVERQAEEDRKAFEVERSAVRKTMQTLLEQIGETGARAGGAFNIAKAWTTERALKVCFFGGGPEIRSHVARIAREWTLYANIDFDFGSPSSPRECTPSEVNHIRIAFQPNQAGWSFSGTDSVRAVPKDQATMGLPIPTAAKSVLQNDPMLKATILHEFGHALGFEHMHQSPSSPCPDEYDWIALKKDLSSPPNNWAQGDIDNFTRKLEATEVKVGDFDRKSIMHHPMPPAFFKAGTKAKCYVERNTELSLKDKLAVFSFYK